MYLFEIKYCLVFENDEYDPNLIEPHAKKRIVANNAEDAVAIIKNSEKWRMVFADDAGGEATVITDVLLCGLTVVAEVDHIQDGLPTI